jgi:integrase
MTVKFYIRDHKKSGKLREDEVSIIARFTLNAKNRFELRSGEKVKPKHWDVKAQQVRAPYPGHYEINIHLSNFKTQLLSLYREHREIPFEKFKLLAQGKQEQKKTLFHTLDQFLKKRQSERDVKTIKKYNTLRDQLTAFDLKHAIDFQTLDFNFYDKFKEHLYSITNPNYRNYCLVPVGNNSGEHHIVLRDDPKAARYTEHHVGLFDDTVFKYIINLKTFLAWAEKRGHQVHSSFKSWEIIRRKHPPISLTKNELEALENFNFNDLETIITKLDVKGLRQKQLNEASKISQSLNIARDYLVMECRTGQRISDIKRFNLKDYSDFKWTFIPRKGQRISSKSITVHFKGYCAPALAILEKYNWKMPVISEQRLNESIKNACKVVGIDEMTEFVRWAQNKRVVLYEPKYSFISTHTGRKTFITLALQAGMPIEYVMELTGISEYSTVKHYRAKFEDQMIEKYLKGIEDNSTIMRKAK